MYTISIIATVAGNIELPSLNCEFKAYNSFEEALFELQTEINERYSNNSSFLNFEMKLPYHNMYGFISNGWFKCAYIFGSMVKYNIVIREIK